MFQGLSTALTALYAAQAGLDTTGNNIANVNTEGYSRQRANQVGTGGTPLPAYYSRALGVGTGVQITDIERIRDDFLEVQSRTAHAQAGTYDVLNDTMSKVELSFGEPGDNGLQSQMSAFWSAWDDIANNPGDLAARSQVIEQGQTLVASFQQTANDLKRTASDDSTKIRSMVASINSMAQSIAGLNSSIRSSIAAGDSPNALLDQRDLLIGKLSDMVGVSVQPTENGSVAVLVGGVALVRDDKVRALQDDATGIPTVIRWDADNDASTVTDGQPATISGGQLDGYLQAVNTIVPKYLTLLDNVATSVITTVNTAHASGVDQNGNPGGPFFTGTDASSIGVDPTLASDTTLVAAASAGGGPLDGENARAIANLASLSNGPDAVYKQLIDVLGVEAQRATRQQSIQATIKTNTDSQRESVSGVNLDEEMSNMIRYQKSYSAAAKYTSVIDSVLEQLINMVH
jgi:flagellar hook-associated protein 1